MLQGRAFHWDGAMHLMKVERNVNLWIDWLHSRKPQCNAQKNNSSEHKTKLKLTQVYVHLCNGRVH